MFLKPDLLVLCQMGQPEGHFGRRRRLHLDPGIIVAHHEENLVGLADERPDAIAEDRLRGNCGIGSLLECRQNSAQKFANGSATAPMSERSILHAMKRVKY